jgi:hypothetical protein
MGLAVAKSVTSDAYRFGSVAKQSDVHYNWCQAAA